MVFNYGWAPQLFGAKRKGGRRHAGIDLGTAGRKGVPLGCPIDGFRVASVKRRGGYGNTVDLISEDGTKMMRFAHLANPLPKHLKVGEPVYAGDWLGNVGNTGGRYAVHLHFEYRVKEGNTFKPVNPFRNKYQTFCRQDFEESTKMAYASRKKIQSGMTLADIHAQKSHLMTQEADQKSALSSVWTLDRGFNQPTWWERIAHPFLGGWTKEQIKEADVQKKLDEEVFYGVRRRELLNQGLTNDDILKLQTHVQEKLNVSNASSQLSQRSVPVNFYELYDDKEKAQIATKFFIEKSSNKS